MSLEIVKEIKKTEAKAETIKNEAKAEAKQVILDNHRACADLLEKARAQAKAHRQATLQRADTSAEDDGARRREEVEAQCEKLTNAAAALMDKAAEHVVERIVKG